MDFETCEQSATVRNVSNKENKAPMSNRLPLHSSARLFNLPNRRAPLSSLTSSNRNRLPYQHHINTNNIANPSANLSAPVASSTPMLTRRNIYKAAHGDDNRPPSTPSSVVSPPTKPKVDPIVYLFKSKNIDLTGSRKLGAGRYSKVVTAKLINSDTTIAIKMIDRAKVAREFNLHFLPREMHCWQRLRHPNIVQLFARYEYNQRVFLVNEYGPGGNLFSFVKQNGPVSEPQAARWMSQMVDAVQYMHSKQIVHRDLKLENIIIFDSRTVKISDFGFAKPVAGMLSQTYCGSKSYSAPEVLLGTPYNPLKADVWSLGVIAFVMITDRMPFNEHVPNNEIAEAQRLRTYRYPSELELSTSCRYTIDSILTYDPIRRPDIAMCAQLPWIYDAALAQLVESAAEVASAVPSTVPSAPPKTPSRHVYD